MAAAQEVVSSSLRVPVGDVRAILRVAVLVLAVLVAVAPDGQEPEPVEIETTEPAPERTGREPTP